MAIVPKSTPVTEKKIKVALYGFDRVGFQPGILTKEINGISYSFVRYSDTSVRLDSFDGVVIPSSIFETISSHKDLYDDQYQTAKYDEKNIFVRDKQLTNHIQEGKWVAFLIGSIVDEIYIGNYETLVIDETDLAKIYLKRFDVRRKRTEGSTLVGPKQNEFGNYIKKYGSCLTRLFPPANDQYKILAAAPGGLIAGVACNSSRVFFLPFLTNNFSSNELVDVAASVSEAVITHRSNKAETVPEWLAEIKFQAEVEILKKLDALQISVDALKSDLSKVESAKMILISSGESLVLRLHQILEDYFGLQIQRIEKYEEDFIILNQDKAGCIVEIKGIKNHIAREHLTKTEAHRDMNGLDATIPALLIINDNTAVSGFEDRKKVNVPGDLVKYATVLNVKILRSIDLLQFMIATEKQTKEERCALLKPIIFSEGGGHLVLKNESLFLKQTK